MAHVCDFCGNECDCDGTDFVCGYQPDNCECPCIGIGDYCDLCGEECECFDDENYPPSNRVTCADCLHNAEYCICDK